MKIRVWLVLLAVVCAVLLSGCQGSAAKTEKSAVAAPEEEKPCSKKPSKPVPQIEYKVSWEEKCLVEQAFDAGAMVLEDLGLAGNRKSRQVRRRDPRTGRMVLKREYDSSQYGRNDGFSAFLRTNTTAGIEFQINILLLPPETSAITVIATSRDQSKEVLKRQSEYLKQKINEMIQQGPAQEESTPYPEMMVFDRTVDEVYDVIYHRWMEREGFNHQNSGGDKYYKTIECKCASEIYFRFEMRMIDTNKTKLEIRVSHYEGKEEFGMILKSLLDILQSIEIEKPVTEDTAGGDK